mgnify:FL=1
MPIYLPLSIYLSLINALAFLLMLADKQRAKKHRWRVPEAVLLGSAAFGGSVGALFGMWLFHHKTRKAKFFITIPLLLAAQCALLYWIYVQ